MKVRNTLQVDLVYNTLVVKLRHFIASTPLMYTNQSSAIEYIKTNFPGWQFNGAAPFEEIMLWCEDHFGNDWLWHYETIYFKNERDLSVFLMRWQ